MKSRASSSSCSYSIQNQSWKWATFVCSLTNSVVPSLSKTENIVVERWSLMVKYSFKQLKRWRGLTSDFGGGASLIPISISATCSWGSRQHPTFSNSSRIRWFEFDVLDDDHGALAKIRETFNILKWRSLAFYQKWCDVVTFVPRPLVRVYSLVVVPSIMNENLLALFSSSTFMFIPSVSETGNFVTGKSWDFWTVVYPSTHL